MFFGCLTILSLGQIKNYVNTLELLVTLMMNMQNQVLNGKLF